MVITMFLTLTMAAFAMKSVYLVCEGSRDTVEVNDRDPEEIAAWEETYDAIDYYAIEKPRWTKPPIGK